MKTIPTFINGSFQGHLTINEMNKIKRQMNEIAYKKYKEERPDHIIYYHGDYHNGELKTVWLYDGLCMTEEEFERVSIMKNKVIGAIHKL